MQLFFISLLYILGDVVWSECDGLYKTVKTHDGNIRGVQNYTLFRNVSYYKFLGIPYAEPPINQLRFKVSIWIFWQLKLVCHFIFLFAYVYNLLFIKS